VKKVITCDLEEYSWESPKGKFKGFGKGVSEALGRDPQSMDLLKRHPFDIEILRIPPGSVPYPFHSHSAQWEFYHIIEGKGKVRHDEGETEVASGDAFIFKPGENHQIINSGGENMILYVVADNPVGETFYYPDSNKLGVPLPSRSWIMAKPCEYFEGEE
jgi:uncharacterized cupin superfamily protein